MFFEVRELLFRDLCGGCKMSLRVHHCVRVVIFFWSSWIVCCLHLKIEIGVCAVGGISGVFYYYHLQTASKN